MAIAATVSPTAAVQPRTQHDGLQQPRGAQSLQRTAWAPVRRHARRCAPLAIPARTLLVRLLQTRGCGCVARRCACSCRRCRRPAADPPLQAASKAWQHGCAGQHCRALLLLLLTLKASEVQTSQANTLHAPHCCCPPAWCRQLEVQAVSAFLKGKTPWRRVPKPPNMGEVRFPSCANAKKTGRRHLRLAQHPSLAWCCSLTSRCTLSSNLLLRFATAPVLQVRSIQQLVNELDEHKDELVVVEVGHCSAASLAVRTPEVQCATHIPGLPPIAGLPLWCAAADDRCVPGL